MEKFIQEKIVLVNDHKVIYQKIIFFNLNNQIQPIKSQLLTRIREWKLQITNAKMFS